MQTTSPVDSDLTLLAVESCRTLHAATSTYAAELEQTIEDGTVISDIVFALLFAVRLHIIRRNSLQEIDVVVCVKLRHLVLGRGFRSLCLLSVFSLNRAKWFIDVFSQRKSSKVLALVNQGQGYMDRERTYISIYL